MRTRAAAAARAAARRAAGRRRTGAGSSTGTPAPGRRRRRREVDAAAAACRRTPPPGEYGPLGEAERETLRRRTGSRPDPAAKKLYGALVLSGGITEADFFHQKKHAYATSMRRRGLKLDRAAERDGAARRRRGDGRGEARGEGGREQRDCR